MAPAGSLWHPYCELREVFLNTLETGIQPGPDRGRNTRRQLLVFELLVIVLFAGHGFSQVQNTLLFVADDDILDRVPLLLAGILTLLFLLVLNPTHRPLGAVNPDVLNAGKAGKELFGRSELALGQHDLFVQGQLQGRQQLFGPVVAAVAVGVEDERGHIKGGIALGVEEGEEQLELNGAQRVRPAQAGAQPLAGAVLLETALKGWQQISKLSWHEPRERFH